MNLQRIRGGIAAWTDDFARELARDLEAAAIDAAAMGPSQLLGLGGAATVAALASALDPSFAPVADRVVARWAATDATAGDDDIMLGHPGAVLAIAELADYRPDLRVPDDFVARCCDRTVAALDRLVSSERPHLTGMAHGLAGLLLACECGAMRLQRGRDDDLVMRAFDLLAATRMVAPGIGTVWTPSSDGTPASVTGAWCHGAAGVALALHTCFTMTGEPAYRELFEEVSSSIERLPLAGPTFCCGRAGRAQVLIELYRQTGERRWLDGARALIRQPVALMLSTDYPDGFQQGALGLAYLDDRLQHPDELGMPAIGFARYPQQSARAAGRRSRS